MKYFSMLLMGVLLVAMTGSKYDDESADLLAKYKAIQAGEFEDEADAMDEIPDAARRPGGYQQGLKELELALQKGEITQEEYDTAMSDMEQLKSFTADDWKDFDKDVENFKKQVSKHN